MRVAFYAPLKPPDHPVPSGEGTIARLLWQALEHAGHEPRLACRLRTYDRGDERRQRRLRAVSERAARLLLARYRRAPWIRPDVWMTYHLYYKAPDWLGPAVARAAGVPYIAIEASLAEKRARGPFAVGHEGVVRALDTASQVVGLNPEDREAVLRKVSTDRYRAIAPFSCPPSGNRASRGRLRARLARQYGLRRDVPWLLCVAMMRAGDKAASYRVLARALTRLPRTGWGLVVAGDGPERGPILSALRAASPDADIVSLGTVEGPVLRDLYASCDLLVWPAVNEAFGMAILEAQLAGLPVVAGDRPGVRAIVRPEETGLLAPPGDAKTLADAILRLLSDPMARARMAATAGRESPARHGLDAAARRLDEILTGLPRIVQR